MKLTRTIISMAAWLAMTTQATGAELDFSYNNSGKEPDIYGFAKMETYDVAIRIDDPSLVGSKVKGFEVLAPSTGTSGHSGWMSTELKLEKKVNKPDIASKAGSVDQDGYLRIMFDEPYTITEEGVYVGYSLTVDKLMEEFDAYPISVVEGKEEYGLYLHTSRSRLKWVEYSERLGAVSTISVLLEGDFRDDAARVSMSGTAYLPAGKASTVEANIINHGAKEISTITYSYKIGEVEGTEEYRFPTPVRASFGATVSAQLPVKAIQQLGVYDLTLTIDKVNGVENADIARTVEGKVEVLPFVPVNRPLVEEYTGMWCGYCPVGYIALETMRKEFGDSFIAAAYHDSDEIATVEELPSYIDGFPSSYMNRGENEVYPADIPTEWQLFRKSVPVADIDVTVEWTNAEQSRLTATSTVRFIKDMDGSDLMVGYILIADGLTNPEWKQSNYLSGEDSLEGECADLFINGGDYVYGLVYNDVVLSPEGIYGVEGSVPAEIKADTPYTHSFSFDTDAVVNLDGEPVIQDPGKLRVVAFLYDYYTDEAINANTSDYADGNPFSALGNISANGSDVKRTDYFDLQGRRIFKPASGFYLKAEKMSDGTSRVKKVVVK